MILDLIIRILLLIIMSCNHYNHHSITNNDDLSTSPLPDADFVAQFEDNDDRFSDLPAADEEYPGEIPEDLDEVINDGKLPISKLEQLFRTTPAVPTYGGMIFKPHNAPLEHHASISDADSPQVTFLGTGCSAPSILRNVSGIHFRWGKGGCRSMLLDCGEGTLGQLVAKWGDHAAAVIADLDAVFISHRHSDHHLGLMSILQIFAQHNDSDRCIDLIVPNVVNHYLTSCMNLYAPHLLHRVNMILCRDLYGPDQLIQSQLCQRLGLSRIALVSALHCADSHSIIVESQTNHWKLVYSGDTRPSQALVNEGANATVLIHEATFVEMLDAAYRKNHSTLRHAVAVGRNMKANRTLLTHFSQRYDDAHELSQIARKLHSDDKSESIPDYAIVSDLMSVRFNQLGWLPLLTAVCPALLLDKSNADGDYSCD